VRADGRGHKAQIAVGEITGIRMLKVWGFCGMAIVWLVALFIPILSLKVLVFVSEKGYALRVTV
jgi:hypothetical protein